MELCSGLICNLNDRYGNDGRGAFFHLHRYRVYNASEGAWMGETLARDGAPRLKDLAWWIAETRLKLEHLCHLSETLAPWLLPAYAALLERPEFPNEQMSGAAITLERLPRLIADLDARLEQVSGSGALDAQCLSAACALRLAMPACLAEADRLRNGLETLAKDCD